MLSWSSGSTFSPIWAGFKVLYVSGTRETSGSGTTFRKFGSGQDRRGAISARQ